jgi:hypothetical protein
MTANAFRVGGRSAVIDRRDSDHFRSSTWRTSFASLQFVGGSEILIHQFHCEIELAVLDARTYGGRGRAV